jgi:hypothetical protein
MIYAYAGAREVACPYCWAGPNKPCVNKDGNPISVHHAARYRAAQKARVV